MTYSAIMPSTLWLSSRFLAMTRRLQTSGQRRTCRILLFFTIQHWWSRGSAPNVCPSSFTVMEWWCRSRRPCMSSAGALISVRGASWNGSYCLLLWWRVLDANTRAGRTLNEIYRCLRWSLSACLAGVHPELDHNNNAWPPQSARAMLAQQPLDPNGKFLAVFSILGDLDEFCNTLGLAHFNSVSPCFWCGCNTRDVPWTDSSPDAAWRATTFATSAWHASSLSSGNLGRSQELLSSQLGGTSFTALTWDPPNMCLAIVWKTSCRFLPLATQFLPGWRRYGPEPSRSTRTWRFRIGSLIWSCPTFAMLVTTPASKRRAMNRDILSQLCSNCCCRWESLDLNTASIGMKCWQLWWDSMRSLMCMTSSWPGQRLRRERGCSWLSCNSIRGWPRKLWNRANCVGNSP